MKKRWMALMTALVLSLGLAGCGEGTAKESTAAGPASQSETGTASESASASESTSASTSASASAAAPAGVPDDGLGEVKANRAYKFGLTIGWRDEFLSKLEAAVSSQAKAYGCDLTAVDANNNANTQISQIQTFAGQKVDAIVCVMVNTEIADQIIAAADGIPVSFVNIVPVGDLDGTNCTKVGSKELEAGQFQGEFLSNYFNEKGVEKVNYVMMQGTLGLGHTTDRTAAAHEYIGKGNYEAVCVYEDTAEYDRAKAQNKMQTFIGTGKR